MKKYQNGMGLENSDTYAKETHNNESNSEIIKKTDIEGTPFIKVQVADRFFIGMGKYRLTQPASEADTDEWVKTITWNKLITVTHIMIESEREYRELQIAMKIEEQAKQRQFEKDNEKKGI